MKKSKRKCHYCEQNVKFGFDLHYDGKVLSRDICALCATFIRAWSNTFTLIEHTDNISKKSVKFWTNAMKNIIERSSIPTEDLIAELKKRGLGVFNLSLPFNFRPNEEIQIHRSSKTKKKTGGDI